MIFNSEPYNIGRLYQFNRHYGSYLDSYRNRSFPIEPYQLPFIYCKDYIIPKDLEKESALNGDYSISSIDTIEGFFNNKKEGIELAVKNILSQLNQRIKIRDSHLEEIEKGICRIGTILLRYDVFNTGDFIINRDTSRLYREVLNFEREKRMEETNFWRDIVLLRKDLIDLLREYKTESWKERLIGFKENDK